MINKFNCLSTVLLDLFYVVTVGKSLTHSLSRFIALITFHASETTLIFADITKAIWTGNKLDDNITAYVSQSSQICTCTCFLKTPVSLQFSDLHLDILFSEKCNSSGVHLREREAVYV